jgi:hypothetical protein
MNYVFSNRCYVCRNARNSKLYHMTYHTDVTKISNIYIYIYINISFVYSNRCYVYRNARNRELYSNRCRVNVHEITNNAISASLGTNSNAVKEYGSRNKGKGILKFVDCLKYFLYVDSGVTTNNWIQYSLFDGQKLRLPEATQLYGKLIVGHCCSSCSSN